MQTGSTLPVDRPIKQGEMDIYFSHLVPDGGRAEHSCLMFSSIFFTIPLVPLQLYMLSPLCLCPIHFPLNPAVEQPVGLPLTVVPSA